MHHQRITAARVASSRNRSVHRPPWRPLRMGFRRALPQKQGSACAAYHDEHQHPTLASAQVFEGVEHPLLATYVPRPGHT